jgi:DNA-binding FrmR family transcriptional regulator
MNEHKTTHEHELVRLRRIEGQIKGVQRMIEQRRYCVDILIQLNSIVGAIKSIEENILDRHLKGCVHQSFTKGSKEDKTRKIEEVVDVLKRFRKH